MKGSMFQQHTLCYHMQRLVHLCTVFQMLIGSICVKRNQCCPLGPLDDSKMDSHVWHAPFCQNMHLYLHDIV